MVVINTRFVLIDNKNKHALVYDKKVCLAKYEFVEGMVFTASEIEQVRTMDYKTKA